MTTPTDAELDAVLTEVVGIDDLHDRWLAEIGRPCARAVLAKWGQPQAVREPLTPEQMDAALGAAKKVKPVYVGWLADQIREWGRAVEKAHGITKGGQHGAP